MVSQQVVSDWRLLVVIRPAEMDLTFDFVPFAEGQLSLSDGRVRSSCHINPARHCAVHALHLTSRTARGRTAERQREGEEPYRTEG